MPGYLGGRNAPALPGVHAPRGYALSAGACGPPSRENEELVVARAELPR
ncbi:hypothetical protein ABT330_27725 [Streptomyces sp. NPDC000658]